MDKLNVVLAVLKKHHFWVLDGLIVVIALVIWFMAGGKVASLFTQRKGNIDASFSQVSSIQPGHPNDKCVDWWKTRTKERSEDVFAGWKILYDKQKQDNQFPEMQKKERLAKFLSQNVKRIYSINEEKNLKVQANHTTK